MFEQYLTVTKDFGTVEEISPCERTNFRTNKGPNWGRVKNGNAANRHLEMPGQESRTLVYLHKDNPLLGWGAACEAHHPPLFVCNPPDRKEASKLEGSPPHCASRALAWAFRLACLSSIGPRTSIPCSAQICQIKFLGVQTLRAQRLKKIKIALRDWNFQSRLKFSSEPPTKPLFFVGILKVRDWKFQSRLKFSIEIDFFQSLGP